MKLRIFSLSTVIFALLIPNGRGLSQSLQGQGTDKHAVVAASSLEGLPYRDSSSTDFAVAEPSPAALVTVPSSGTAMPKTVRPFSRVGIDSHMGVGGVGFDIATPLSRNFNLRAGSDFFSYSTVFQEEGANISVNLHMQSGHTSLDWFPFGGRFRMSSLMTFANNNRALATALIPSGSTVTLNGQNYISSFTDPLHGSGSVEFRRVSPGFTIGFGNIISRDRSRFSIPIEFGFYYAGQPGLKVSFSGSACDPTQPPSIGCQSVSQDPGFQQNLTAFIVRNNHNLSYASFFPVLSIGFGRASKN
jgi:hypothetical protein